MLNWKLKHKFNKAEDPGVASGYNESKTETPPPKPPENPAPAQEAGTEFDELGYEVQKPEGDKNSSGDAEQKAKPVDSKGDSEIKDPASGYGGKAPEPVEEKKDPPAPTTDVELGFELKVDEIIPKEEALKIKEFAKTHKMSKEATQAYLDLRKSDLEAVQKKQAEQKVEMERQVKAQRANWYNELKNDQAFGGEKFNHNVMLAERVLQEFMPNTKKTLTERQSMLPPYVMRDLAKLGKHLYSSDQIVQGEPPVPNEEKEPVDDALAFYQ